MSYAIVDPVTSELAANKTNKDGSDLTNPAAWRGNLGLIPLRLTVSGVAAMRTATVTPAAVQAEGSALSARAYVVIRNESAHTRVRIGRLQANLQRDGEPLEPGSVARIDLDPATATDIYMCSEGAPVVCHILEDVA